MAPKKNRWNTVKGWLKHPDVRRDAAPAPTPQATEREVWRVFDGLENAFLGYNTSRDKLTFGSFTIGCRLSDTELHAMYYADDISAKIVNQRPEEMLRRGYKLVSKTSPSVAETLEEKGKALDVRGNVLRAMQWGRLYGGSVVVLGANDSPDLTKPLDPKRVREVKFLNVVDRRYAGVVAYQDNPSLPRLGQPELYSVGSPGSNPVTFHASRLVRFDGVEETDPQTRRYLGGWTYSVLQRPYEVLRGFATSFKSVEHLISDASQGVFKLQNLLDALAADKQAVLDRLALLDMSRSAGRAVVVDAETEDFTRIATSFAGIDAVIDRLMMRVSSAADMPVTILFGRSPAGMNATGESDFRSWYDVLATEQENILEPALLQIYRAIGGPSTPEDLEIEFCPLWEPTEKEEADTAYAVAQTDKLYVDMGAVLPEEVAIARFGSGEGKIEIDEAALKKSKANEIDLMLNPPPDPAPAANGQAADPNATNAGQANQSG